MAAGKSSEIGKVFQAFNASLVSSIRVCPKHPKVEQFLLDNIENQRNPIHLRFCFFDKAHPGFVSRIKERFPILTPSEVRYLMMVRMHVKDGQMAEMLGVGQEAIRQNRYRIRRKIAIPESENLEEIVLSIWKSI